MRAIVQSRYGPPAQVLRVAEAERPAIKDDQVLVRVRAASVHADIWHSVTGTPYSWRMMFGWRAPRHPVPGTDLAGVVESVGTRVTRFKPGEEVFGQTVRSFAIGNGGAFAEPLIAQTSGETSPGRSAEPSMYMSGRSSDKWTRISRTANERFRSCKRRGRLSNSSGHPPVLHPRRHTPASIQSIRCAAKPVNTHQPKTPCSILTRTSSTS